MDYSLLRRAEEIWSGLDMGGLARAGLRPRRVTFDVSHSIVVYPHKHRMGEVDPDDIFSQPLGNVSLYFHFPFCTGKCGYCHYISFPKMSDAVVDDYLKSLSKEVELVKDTGQLENSVVRTVFFGGGTPTYMKSSQLVRIIDSVFESFNIPESAEATIEAAPETVTADKISLLKESGINRMSVGFQEFDDRILKDIGRRHDSSSAKAAYKTIKDCEIECVNIDLMIGLPDQKPNHIANMLEGVAEVMPDSITIYNTRLKTHVPMYQTFVNQPMRFANEKELLIMRIMLQEGLRELGYKQELLRWFVKDEKDALRYQRHKWGESADVLGFGLSAYSFVNNCQYINHDILPNYHASLGKNKLPIEKGKFLTESESMRRTMIFGLRAGLDKSEFKSRYGVMPEEVFGEEIARFEALGLLKNGKRDIELTYKGALVGEEVCGSFASESALPLRQKEHVAAGL